jgi:hypothetical protein
MRADRLHASLEVPFKHNRCDSRQCVQGPFKAYQPALATTLLNGHYKSKESEKEIICQELRIGRKENAKRRLRPCCLRRSLRFALKVGQLVVSVCQSACTRQGLDTASLAIQESNTIKRFSI